VRAYSDRSEDGLAVAVAQPSMATVQNPYLLSRPFPVAPARWRFPLAYPIRGAPGGHGRLRGSAPRCPSRHAVAVRSSQLQPAAPTATSSGGRRRTPNRRWAARSAPTRCRRLRA